MIKWANCSKLSGHKITSTERLTLDISPTWTVCHNPQLPAKPTPLPWTQLPAAQCSYYTQWTDIIQLVRWLINQLTPLTDYSFESAITIDPVSLESLQGSSGMTGWLLCWRLGGINATYLMSALNLFGPNSPLLVNGCNFEQATDEWLWPHEVSLCLVSPGNQLKGLHVPGI